MALFRRFTSFPGIEVLDDIEAVNVVDLTGPAPITALGSGTACIVGEFLKGSYDPTVVTTTQDLLSVYGGYSAVIPHSSLSNRALSNGFLALARKQFSRLVIQRVDMRAADAASGVAGTGDISLTFSGTPTPTMQDFVLPAGFRFADAAGGAATVIVALADDVTVPKGTALPFVVPGVKVFFVQGTVATGATAIDTVFDSIATFGFPSTMALAVTQTDATIAIPAAATVTGALDTQYLAAIDKTLPSVEPTTEINIIWAAHESSLIRDRLKSNAVDASAVSRGRMAVLRAAAGTAKPTSNAAAETAFGAGNRTARAIWTYPHVQFNPQVQDSITGALTTAFPAVGLDSFMASILSTLAPERNPGEPSIEVLQNIIGFETPTPTGFPMLQADYINFRAFGMAVLRKDQATGFEFQSGVTSVNPTSEPTKTEIKRQRMADFINDSLSVIASRYTKTLATRERRDAILGEYNRFLADLKSTNNPAAQRIVDFAIDTKNGNTPQLNGLGIFVDRIDVQLLQDQRALVIQSTIGETVQIQVA
jgi:hypothetical protein